MTPTGSPQLLRIVGADRDAAREFDLTALSERIRRLKDERAAVSAQSRKVVALIRKTIARVRQDRCARDGRS